MQRLRESVTSIFLGHLNLGILGDATRSYQCIKFKQKNISLFLCLISIQDKRKSKDPQLLIKWLTSIGETLIEKNQHLLTLGSLLSRYHLDLCRKDLKRELKGDISSVRAGKYPRYPLAWIYFFTVDSGISIQVMWRSRENVMDYIDTIKFVKDETLFNASEKLIILCDPYELSSPYHQALLAEESSYQILNKPITISFYRFVDSVNDNSQVRITEPKTLLMNKVTNRTYYLPIPRNSNDVSILLESSFLVGVDVNLWKFHLACTIFSVFRGTPSPRFNMCQTFNLTYKSCSSFKIPTSLHDAKDFMGICCVLHRQNELCANLAKKDCARLFQ